MSNLDYPKWVMDLLSENGEPYRLSRDDYEKLEAFCIRGLNLRRTLQQMADRRLSERYETVKSQIKTQLEYNWRIHTTPAAETVGKAKLPPEVPAPLDGIPPGATTVQTNVEGSGISPVFTGPWKHLYEFLWHQGFDSSQSQDDYKTVFKTYRSEFGKKSTGSGKRKKAAYRMPSNSDAKSVRQGYHRQLERHQTRQ